MCRDRAYNATKKEHVVRFGLEDDDFYSLSYNQIAGQAGLPIVVYDSVEDRNTSVDAVWGLVPQWSKSIPEGLRDANRYVNAKVENLEDSRMYKPLLIAGQRCLIPCTHYFEHHWVDGGKVKVPFAVRKKDDQIFTIPGLYSIWTSHGSADLIVSYTMLTTNANSLMAKVHNGGDHPGRMPLAIEREHEKTWLDPNASAKDIEAVLQYRIPASELDAWPVHPIRGKKALMGPAVLEPVPEYAQLLAKA